MSSVLYPAPTGRPQLIQRGAMHTWYAEWVLKMTQHQALLQPALPPASAQSCAGRLPNSEGHARSGAVAVPVGAPAHRHQRALLLGVPHGYGSPAVHRVRFHEPVGTYPCVIGSVGLAVHVPPRRIASLTECPAMTRAVPCTSPLLARDIRRSPH